MRKRNTTKRCFICIELGHLTKNYMNTRIIEDEKKEKEDNIKKLGLCQLDMQFSICY